MNALEGLTAGIPGVVDVEANSLTTLGKPQLTNLVKYAMDILNQRKWYAGWYSYTNYINSYMNASALANYPLWVADYRSSPGYTGQYGMWQYCRFRHRQRHYRRGGSGLQLSGLSAHDTRREF